jgi:glutamyl-tRNA synthetase
MAARLNIRAPRCDKGAPVAVWTCCFMTPLPPVVRFAPSPTGRIHIGNARTALMNFLYASRLGGRFVLRFDDTDPARSREEFAQAIEVDLAWLGIAPNLVVRQSGRLPVYAAGARKLAAGGRLYRAYETAEELERKRRRQQARGLPPVYDRAALALTEADHAALAAEGRRPHWRFRLDPGTVAWTDLVRGETRIDCASLSDPVLVREDGSYLYTLPSVVDDVDLGITHVIRGEDHVTNTAVQIQIFEALAGAGRVPVFAHHNLLLDAAGAGLSKRTGALSIGALREEGIEALAVAALAVLTGSSDDIHAVPSLAKLAAVFDLSHVSRNPARFDEAELRGLSARTLHGLPFEAVRDRLAVFDIVGHKAEPFWLAVRGNLARFAETADWWRVVSAGIAPRIEDADFCATAATLLPEEPLGEGSWSTWTNALKERTGRKGRALFHPLRLALTGREDGPELAKLLPLIGRAAAATRLGG